MSIISKMLKYLKNYSNLITCSTIIALIIILIVQSVKLDNYKSSYEEENNLNSIISFELDGAKSEINKLKSEVAEYKNQLIEKDEEIENLKTDVEELKKSNKKQTSSVKTPTKPSTTTPSGSSATNSNKTESSDTISSDVPVSDTASSVPEGDYSQARQVWNHLISMGLNKYVCAGIMGNIMAEVGGQTLDISRWPTYSKGSYYGICQWGGSRRSRLLNSYGKSLDAQLSFLSVELYEVIPKSNSFYNMQNEKDAALYFAKYYERCGSGSYSVRQRNATKALNYFAG